MRLPLSRLHDDPGVRQEAEPGIRTRRPGDKVPNVIDWPEFQHRAELGKLALGGHWESAVTFRRGDFMTQTEAMAYLGESREVTCEAFFGASFFGIRLHGDPRELARDVVHFAQSMEAADSGRQLLTAVADALQVPLGRDFRYAEIGAEGAWNSVGAFRIDDPYALKEFDDLWREVSASAVGRDTTHQEALEFTYDNDRGDGTNHWFALPVSTRDMLDRSKVTSALQRFARRLQI